MVESTLIKILIGAILFGSLFVVKKKKTQKIIFWILIAYLTLIGIEVI